MALTEQEQRVIDDIAARREELVALAAALIGFDTTARNPGDPPRDEVALQTFLGARLSEAGAEVEIFEPTPEEIDGKPLVPPGLDFVGRPQMIARFPGRGSGRSLIFNGHIDAVSYEPRDRWTSDPLRAEIRDGLLYGRGSCDMKGGIAAMTSRPRRLPASASNWPATWSSRPTPTKSRQAREARRWFNTV